MYDDRRKYLLGGLLLVLLALGLTAGWVLWHKKQPGTYGAIALSESSLGYGTSWGYTDPAAAADRAQKECARAGVTDCAVRVSMVGSCAALVMSPEHGQSFAVNDMDKDSAGALALAQCQASGATDCTVQANFCGSGG